jgi:hypothetical protein
MAVTGQDVFEVLKQVADATLPGCLRTGIGRVLPQEMCLYPATRRSTSRT